MTSRPMLAVGALGILLVVVLLGAVFLERVAETPIQGNIVIDDGKPYADLVPAPDSIVWHKGQVSTVVLSSNLEHVHLEIDSVSMGIDSLKGAIPHSGELMVLGASVGCQDWAVSRLYADSLQHNAFVLRGEIERDNFTGNAEVHWRYRERGSGRWLSWTGGLDSHTVTGTTTVFSVSTPSNPLSFSSSSHNKIWEIEASSDATFPTALTRSITMDLKAKPETSTEDDEVETIVLLKDTGVDLEACSEHDDLNLYLYDDEGAELNHYIVDIGAAPPTPTTPGFSPRYRTARFCADADAPRANLLTSGETVGTVTASSGSVTYSLAPDGDSRDYAFFDISSSTGAITVSDAGADDHTGIDGTRLYTFLVRAADSDGRTADALVVVQLDLTNLATNDDGVCP